MNKRLARQQQMMESLTPEEIIARGQRAKLRFRAAIRFVMENLYWLEDADDEVLGDDVRKNILLLTRKKGKKSLLSLQDKWILSKAAGRRTEDEKLHLSRIIGGLKCFRRYPRHVKTHLAGVTYFLYYGPGRTIVRQGHPSDGLYFIITGTVNILQDAFDPIFNEMVNKNVGTMGPGSMFGEAALLHDMPRASTVVSKTHVELLCLKKEDFNVVLKATIQEQWDTVQRAMRLFTYFDDWSNTTIRDGCILGKLKTYSPDQTVLGDGYGHYDYVYFIMYGKCRVIEHLLVTSEMKAGKKYYKHYVPSSSTESSTSDLLEGEAKDEEIVFKSLVADPSEVEAKCDGPSQCHDQNQKKSKATQQNSPQLISMKSKQTVNTQTESGKSQRAVNLGRGKINKKMLFTESQGSGSSFSHGSVIESTDKKSSGRTTAAVARAGISSSKCASQGFDMYLPSNVETHFIQIKVLVGTGGNNMQSYNTNMLRLVMADSLTKQFSYSDKTMNDIQKLTFVEEKCVALFMVAILNQTACFGIGENLENRRVVAVLPTECLILPRYWLMQQNQGNIWNRVRHFLNSHVPTTKQVFKQFVDQRNWIAYRKKILAEVLPERRKISNNSLRNVPYFIRINEEIHL